MKIITVFYDVVGVRSSTTNSSAEGFYNYGDTTVESSANNKRILEFEFYNNKGGNIKYNVEVADSKIIFNNKKKFIK